MSQEALYAGSWRAIKLFTQNERWKLQQHLSTCLCTWRSNELSHLRGDYWDNRMGWNWWRNLTCHQEKDNTASFLYPFPYLQTQTFYPIHLQKDNSQNTVICRDYITHSTLKVLNVCRSGCLCLQRNLNWIINYPHRCHMVETPCSHWMRL